MKKIYTLICSFVLAILFFAPFCASAHEVYVLSPEEIRSAVAMPSPNPFTVIPEQEKEFLFWGALCAVGVLLVLTLSVSKMFEKIFDPFLMKLKKVAPLLGRLTLGASVFLSGYHHAFFGPELPFSVFLSPQAEHVFALVVMIAAVFISFGLLTRLMALFGLILYIFLCAHYGIYMVTYANYLGEMILFLILGGGPLSLDRVMSPFKIEKMFFGIARILEPYAFFIMRMFFGSALIFASFYAKFLHSNLALDTVADYHLTNYFHFTPLFLVLGAFIVESIIGICFFIGFEIRFMALVFISFITLSISFFGEAVWPHLILFGVAATLLCHGYDKYTAEKAIFERIRDGEPVL